MFPAIIKIVLLTHPQLAVVLLWGWHEMAENTFLCYSVDPLEMFNVCKYVSIYIYQWKFCATERSIRSNEYFNGSQLPDFKLDVMLDCCILLYYIFLYTEYIQRQRHTWGCNEKRRMESTIIAASTIQARSGVATDCSSGEHKKKRISNGTYCASSTARHQIMQHHTNSIGVQRSIGGMDGLFVRHTMRQPRQQPTARCIENSPECIITC